MSAMHAIYKCELCKKEFTYFTTGKQNADLIAIDFTSECNVSDVSKLFCANKNCVHYCGNGDLGFANFIGFKMEVEDEKENDS